MNKQTLFELLDDELDAAQVEQVLDQLLADPDLQKSWESHYLIRTALKERGLVGQCNMVDRVAEALEDEPTVMAPDALTTQFSPPPIEDASSNVVPIGHRNRRYLAYAAVAASLLAVVVLTNPIQTPEAPTVADTRQAPVVTPAAEQALQSLIVQHGEFSGAAALNGLVAYAKVVNGSTYSGSPEH